MHSHFMKKHLKSKKYLCLNTILTLFLTYMNFGNVYHITGKYSTALSYFERGLEIAEASLPENHRWLQALRQNIALLEKEL